MSEEQDQTDTNTENADESAATEGAASADEGSDDGVEGGAANDASDASEGPEATGDDADDADTDDDDESDDDEKDEKPKKPKKVKISYEAAMPRSEAVSYFEAIVGGLRSGRLEFRQEGDHLVLSPPDQLEIEVKAQRKGDKAKVVFEIAWSDESNSLEILN